MSLAIPNSLLYAIGTVLVVFGALRAYHLGWRNRPEPVAPRPARAAGGEEAGGEEAEDPDADLDAEIAKAAAWDRDRGGGYKRHLMFGLLWIGLGLFLIISTIVKSRTE